MKFAENKPGYMGLKLFISLFNKIRIHLYKYIFFNKISSKKRIFLQFKSHILKP